jgi:MoxR-like ATPase
MKSMVLTWPETEQVICRSRLTLLYGPPGTGKTTAAIRAGSPSSVYNLTLTDETAAAEVRGHFIPRGGEFVWMDGPGMRAFRQGARLVLNEIDKASDDCLDYCHALLDDPGVAAITLPTGETVSPGEGYSVVLTMNGQPEDLPDAIADRLAVAIEVLEPHPAALARFSEPIQDAIRGTVAGDQNVGRRASLRAFNAYVDLAAALGDDLAARAVFAERAEEVLSAIRLAGER